MQVLDLNPDEKKYEKRPKLTKEERKAKQEAQRAAKEARKSSTPTAAPLQYDDCKKVAKKSKNAIVTRSHAQRPMTLFSHLPQYERLNSYEMNISFSESCQIHPSIVALGLKNADGILSGSNERCIAMLKAFQKVIQDVTVVAGEVGYELFAARSTVLLIIFIEH